MTATSHADASKSASASIAITSDITLTIQSSPAATSIQTGATLQLTAVVNSQGHPDDTVTWSVNGVQNGNTTFGTIATTSGNTATYTAPAAVPNPSTVTITGTSVADPTKSDNVQVAITPLRIDFSRLPDNITTNLSTFFVSGSATQGGTASVNGTSVPVDSVGNFIFPVRLASGANRIELDIQSAQNGTLTFVKTVTFDTTFSTAGNRLLYVSSIATSFSGTFVIDVDDNIFLGFIENKHVRGISPDGSQIYMDDLSVVSTSTHQELPSPSSPLAFTQPIPTDGFVVSPDGSQLYSDEEILNLMTNQLLTTSLPASIETGYTYAGPTQGGPAISPDGKVIFFGPPGYCCEPITNGLIGKLDTVANTVTGTGIQPSGAYLSDIALTPDGKRMLVSSYGWEVGDGDIFDANSDQKLASVNFGDFAGQVGGSPDGTKAIFGSAGNPQFQGGVLTVVDIASGAVTATVTTDLADHLVVSDRSEVFASSDDVPGIDMFALRTDGTLAPLKQFVLGINQFMLTCCYGAPQNDDIENIVFKP